MNRREFIFGTVATSALAGCSTARTGLRPLAPGEKRKIAMIGCGIQMRKALIPQFLNPEYNATMRIAVTCDCDRVRAAAAARQVNDAYGDGSCRALGDFREVLADPEIDAVCIATPDHWHAYISVEAMKRGKDVYCEKPMTFSIDEAKKVIAAQEKYGRVFQTGSMQRSWRVFRTAASLVRGGAIGDVRFVDVNYGFGGQKYDATSHPSRFFDDPANAVKEGAPNPDVDWNMWLGPAAWRPYSDQLAPRGVHDFFPLFWRYDDDIAAGLNGDWGAHHFDTAQWALGLDRSGPYRVLRSDAPHGTDPFQGGRRQRGMRMMFHTRGGDVELRHGPFSTWGTVFYGTNGIVAVNRGKIAVWVGTGLVRPDDAVRAAIQDFKTPFRREKLVASSVGKDYGTDMLVKKDDRLNGELDKLERLYADEIAKAGLYVSPNQVQNFCSCVETRQRTISPAEVGGRGVTMCHLCNMCYRYDCDIEWNPEKMDFSDGNPRGLPLARARYRNGFDVVV